MKRINFITQISQAEDSFYRFLFKKFGKELPTLYKINNTKTIPFSYVYFWFSFRKINKADARGIITKWVLLGFCKRLLYHGIKLQGGG